MRGELSTALRFLTTLFFSFFFFLSTPFPNSRTYPHDPVHGVRIHGPHPPAYALERPTVSDVVNQQDAHRAPVVTRRNGAEALLAGGVPDLKLDRLAVEQHIFDLEVDSGEFFLAAGEGEREREGAREKKEGREVSKQRKDREEVEVEFFPFFLRRRLLRFRLSFFLSFSLSLSVVFSINQLTRSS